MPETTCAAMRVSPGAVRHDMGIGHKNRGPERDQRVGSQAGEALAPLPLEADCRAEARGDEEIRSGLRELHGHEELREICGAGGRAAQAPTAGASEIRFVGAGLLRRKGDRRRLCASRLVLETAARPPPAGGRWNRAPAGLAAHPLPIASITTRNSTSAAATTR